MLSKDLQISITDLDGRAAQTTGWMLGFAKKKMNQYVDLLNMLGQEEGRKTLVMADGTIIDLKPTPYFGKIHIKIPTMAGGEKKFAKEEFKKEEEAVSKEMKYPLTAFQEGVTPCFTLIDSDFKVIGYLPVSYTGKEIGYVFEKQPWSDKPGGYTKLPDLDFDWKEGEEPVLDEKMEVKDFDEVEDVSDHGLGLYFTRRNHAFSDPILCEDVNLADYPTCLTVHHKDGSELMGSSFYFLPIIEPVSAPEYPTHYPYGYQMWVEDWHLGNYSNEVGHYDNENPTDGVSGGHIDLAFHDPMTVQGLLCYWPVGPAAPYFGDYMVVHQTNDIIFFDSEWNDIKHIRYPLCYRDQNGKIPEAYSFFYSYQKYNGTPRPDDNYELHLNCSGKDYLIYDKPDNMFSDHVTLRIYEYGGETYFLYSIVVTISDDGENPKYRIYYGMVIRNNKKETYTHYRVDYEAFEKTKYNAEYYHDIVSSNNETFRSNGDFYLINIPTQYYDQANNIIGGD
jgi:hypothetical protein